LTMPAISDVSAILSFSTFGISSSARDGTK
jgi:hypothetical protein